MSRGQTTKSGRLAFLAAAAAVVGAACAQPRVAEIYPQVAEYDGRRIEELSFVDPEPFTADSLDELTETEETHCSLGFLPFCLPGTDIGLRVRRLDMRAVGGDIGRLEAFYRRHGYFGTRVVPEIEEVSGEDGPIAVRFMVRRGDGVVVDSVVVEGTEGIADPDSLESELPLQPGELLNLNEFLASADTVLSALQVRGHAYAEVLRNYAVDTIQDRGTVWLLAVPGPRVEVDSVIVDGLSELRRDDVARQLTFDSGDLLRLRDLRASQRNLYELELIRFASVAVAADSLQRTPADSTTATVRVALAEAPEYLVETAVGFGSVECLRGRGEWTDRSVLGGGRQLTLGASVSRIGLGGPVGGLEGICQQGEDTEIATELDFRLAADFTQPYFLAPENRLAAGLFWERQSQPGIYQRTARGVQATLSRRFRPRELLTAGLSAEYRETTAAPLLYCVEFRACDAEEVERLQGGRWRNAFHATYLRDRGNRALNPTAGYVLRTTAAWSTSLLGSDYDFLRGDVEGSIYRSIGRGWVLAGFARVGSFITRADLGPTSNFIPPEERFFVGGASSVRGYQRFGVGPGLYVVENDALDPASIVPSDTLDVDFIPTGGTSAAVVSAEARFPSPVLRDLLRLAVFVDAGTVGVEPVWKMDSEWRITPGAGFRIGTPVGPIRVDVGYNPYDAPVAPLYSRDLVQIAESHQEASPGPFDLDRFTLHIAVGQPF